MAYIVSFPDTSHGLSPPSAVRVFQEIERINGEMHVYVNIAI